MRRPLLIIFVAATLPATLAGAQQRVDEVAGAPEEVAGTRGEVAGAREDEAAAPEEEAGAQVEDRVLRQPALTSDPESIDRQTTLVTATQGTEGGELTISGAMQFGRWPDVHTLALAVNAPDDDENGVADILGFDGNFPGSIEFALTWTAVIGYEIQTDRLIILEDVCRRHQISVPCATSDLRGHPEALREYNQRIGPDQTPWVLGAGIAAGYHRLEYSDPMNGYEARVDEQPSVRAYFGAGFWAHPRLMIATNLSLRRAIAVPEQEPICSATDPTMANCTLGNTGGLITTWKFDPKVEVRGYLHPSVAMALTSTFSFYEDTDLPFTSSHDEGPFTFRHVDIQLSAYLAATDDLRIAVRPGIRVWGIAHDADGDGVGDQTVDFIGAITLGAALDPWQP